MNQDLAPGRGVRVELAEDAVRGLTSALADVCDTLTMGGDVIENLCSEVFNWTESEDSYGRKAVHAVELPNGGEIRISVIEQNGEVRLDIREWWKPIG